jgi:hypothetical protein
VIRAHRPCPQYAELHYAPWGRALSRLWQPWPEIYLDLPWRVRAGRPLPLLLAWADAHRYPVLLRELALTWLSPRGELRRDRLACDLRVESALGGALPLETALEEPGLWQCWVDALVERLPGSAGAAGQTLRFRNQLTARLPEEPLQVRVDAEPLPLLPGLLRGDPHAHASGTRDMIEFGPPPELLRAAAGALELDWFALTDHSYDLDDASDCWRRRDPALPAWRAQQDWLRAAAATPGPFVLPGEECSAGGLGGGVLHLLLLDPDRFYAGSADGGESLLPRRPEWRLPALLEALRGTGCLPVSAHTGESPGPAERVLLRRRAWREADLDLLGAHQILSGGLGGPFAAGRALWLEQLRRGRAAAILAGGDSHGHFSLARRLQLPGLALSWNREGLFGRYCSAVRLEGGAEALAPAAGGARSGRLLAELAAGRCLLGDGPLLAFEDEAGGLHWGGALPSPRRLALRAWTLPAGGPLLNLRLFGGGYGGEELLGEWREGGVELSLPLDESWLGRRWLRAELRQRDAFAMTNALRLEG